MIIRIEKSGGSFVGAGKYFLRRFIAFFSLFTGHIDGVVVLLACRLLLGSFLLVELLSCFRESNPRRFR